MKDFSGKVAVITGAGRGIGRGIALRCAKEGMKVVLAGIGLESLTRTEADLRAMGASTVVVLMETLYFELARSAPHIKVSVYCPGQVNTDIPNCERNRPAEFQTDPHAYQATPDEEARWESLRKRLSSAVSIDESADILFRGIREDKLYIGPLGFRGQHPKLEAQLRDRTNNIITENNPET